MRLFFCPECGKKQVLNHDPYENKHTITNMRCGYGRPIRHYKCECGNYLAGSMDVTNWDEEGIKYAMDVIKSYNKGGTFYNFDDTQDIAEHAEIVYKKRKRRVNK